MIHHANSSSPRFIISRKLYVTIFQCRVQFRPSKETRTITFHLLLTAAIISRSNFTPLHISIGQFLFIKLDVGRNRPLPALPSQSEIGGGRRRGGFDQVLETRNPLITEARPPLQKGFREKRKLQFRVHEPGTALRRSNKSRFFRPEADLSSSSSSFSSFPSSRDPCFRKRFEVSITFSRVVLSKSYTANRISRFQRTNF